MFAGENFRMTPKKFHALDLIKKGLKRCIKKSCVCTCYTKSFYHDLIEHLRTATSSCKTGGMKACNIIRKRF